MGGHLHITGRSYISIIVGTAHIGSTEVEEQGVRTAHTEGREKDKGRDKEKRKRTEAFVPRL